MPAPNKVYSVSVDGIALVAATAKTVLEIGSTTTSGFTPYKWWVTFDGVTASAVPVKVEVGRFSAGVTTATTITPSKVNFGNNSIAANSVVKHSTTVEGAGTASDVEIYRVPPTSGMVMEDALGREWVMGASSFWRIRLTAAAGVNVTFGIKWEE